MSSVGASPQATQDEGLRDAVIRLAGNSQDGIQTVGGMLGKLAGRTAQEVMTYMTIPSTISGGPSIFQVHLGSGEVLHAGDEADVLVAFYQHSYDDHIGDLKDGGICLYDLDKVEQTKDQRGIHHLAVPFTSATVEAIGGTAKDRGKNIFVLGLLCSMFRLEKEKLVGIIERQFGNKSEDILRNCLNAFDAGFAFQTTDLRQFQFVPGEAGNSKRISSDGNTMMAFGLIAGGVRYGAGYPITPWSSIMELLRRELPKYGGVFMQAEDELAAVGIALGVSYAGHLSVTGSSGPGLSLKSETIGYASMAELPLLVINVQRGGPSTGLPTSVEQSDLLQAIYGSHGDSPRIVLAPKNVEDCFYIALEAAQIAKRYSCPVIILSDQALATRIEAFTEPNLEEHWIEPDLDLSERGEDFKPYPIDGLTQHAPPGTPMADGTYPKVTGLEHDEMGHPSGNPENHQKMTNKRRDKLVDLAAELPLPDVYREEDGEILLLGWGSTYGPIREACDRLRDKGLCASATHIRHLHPLPRGMDDLMAKYEHIFVVEMNDHGLYGSGQLATILRAAYANPAIQSICKTDGLAYRVSEIVDGVDQLLA